MTAVQDRTYDQGWAYADYAARNPRLLAYSGPTLRSVWAEAVRWVLKVQTDWDTLDAATAVQELRKGPLSVFYPLFRDNPRISVDCPEDGRVTITAEGYCDRCTYEFDR